MNKTVMVLYVVMISSCSAKQEKKPETTPVKSTAATTSITLTDAQIKNAGIETGKPGMRSMHSTLKVNGLIDVPPQNMVTVSFPSGGYVKSTKLLPGMRISKGQVLAVMQDPSIIQMQENYLMAQAKFVFLQKEYERQKLLNATKASSDKVFEQSVNDFQSVKISLRALREQLLLIGINPDRLTENTISRSVNIYASISGFVAVVRVNTGKYVNPTDVLFDLVNTSDLHLALTVFEKDLDAIRPGQLVRSYLTGDTARVFNSKVMLVSKTLDSNRSALVHCHFIGAEPNLLPGTFMNADIEITNASVISVPEDAVVRSGEHEYIFIEQKDHVFEMVPINAATSENGYTAIDAGNIDLLNRVIITKNAYAALMKMKNTGDEE